MFCLFWIVSAFANPSMQLALGEGHLKQGKPAQAAELFQAILDERPMHARARSGLLRSLERLGRCPAALDVASKISRYVSTETSIAQASCLRQVGRVDDARALLELELQSAPFDGRVLEELVRLYALTYRKDEAYQAMELLQQRSEMAVSAGLIRMELYQVFGDERFDSQATVMERFSGNVDIRRRIAVARAWRALDEGDVPGAERWLAGKLYAFKDHRFAVLMAEVRRRSGQPAGAVDTLLRRRSVEALDHKARLVHARALADLGRHEEAEQALNGQLASCGEDAATAWYLYQARSSDKATRARTAFEQCPGNPLLTLEDYIPGPLREGDDKGSTE